MNSDPKSNLSEKTRFGSMIDHQSLDCSEKGRSSIHDCKVVRVEPPNIVTHWSDERDHVHSVGLDAVIIVDGHTCPLTNLRSVSAIRLTTKRGNPLAVSRIESSANLRRQYR